MAVWGMGVPACFSGAGYLSEHGLNTGATTKGRICSPFSGMLLSANLLFAIEDKVFDKKVEMVSFKLGEELRKMFFCLVTSVGQRKILSPHEESNLRPLHLHSDALPLSHKDSSVRGVYYRVLMTHVLHTARISNVHSIMFLTEK